MTSNGVVYVGSTDGIVYGFDQNGVNGCTSGTPKSCSPRWTSAPQGQAIDSSAMVAGDGTLFVGGGDDRLYAYDSTGTNGCSGSPVVCQPEWTGLGSGGGDMSSAITINGLVFAHDATNLYAYDASGHQSCSGTPRTCQPIWMAPGVGSGYSQPVAWAGNIVYIAGNSGLGALRLSQ